MNGNYYAERKNVEIPVDPNKKQEKWIASAQDKPRTIFKTSQPRSIKRGKYNTFSNIFINYRELHDNYQHSWG